MIALLDTHTLLWWVAGDPRLSKTAAELLADRSARILWSAASTWELAIKASVGKVSLHARVGEWLQHRFVQQGIEVLPILHTHAAAVEQLPAHHRDPFDRLLVAQASVESIPILTGDKLIGAYEVETIW